MSPNSFHIYALYRFIRPQCLHKFQNVTFYCVNFDYVGSCTQRNKPKNHNVYYSPRNIVILYDEQQIDLKSSLYYRNQAVIYIILFPGVLCVSCPSATEFSAVLFLLLARSSSNSPWSFQCFRRTLRRNFNLIRQQMKNVPIDPHCKNCPLSVTLQRCRRQAIFTMGVYGEILYPLSDLNEIWHQSSSKTLKWSRCVWAWSGKK